MATKGVGVFNAIRSNASTTFKDIVPMASLENIQTLSNILFNDAYQPQLNEFVNSLINRIALTIVRNKSFNNPLAIFKKGAVPLGTDIQEIFTNPATGKPYEYSNSAMAELLTITDPDTKVAYYRRNRRDKYTKTISREGLQGAFASWENFEDFISSITNSLYSGNYIDEFKYTKALIDGVYDNDKAIVEVIENPVDESTSKAFLKKVRALYSQMSFPSTEYNAYSKFEPTDTPVVTWTDKERVVLIIRADVMAEIDVEALASAFNIDKADFMGRVIQVDKFDSENIKAVICDEAFLQIYDNVFRFDEFYNASTMSWNYYLHAWSTFAVSPFANAVILATSEPTPATSVSIGTNPVELSLSSNPNFETLEITVEPANATADVEFISSDKEIFTVTKAGAKKVTVTPIKEGSAELTAVTDNGLSDKVTVNVGA